MPDALSYPGVYIEDIPSGHAAIRGVATSITAFVGRTRFGPTDEPVTLFSFGDYERMFGGLAYEYPLSYAVQDFFINGGGQAIVARLFEPTPAYRAGLATISLDSTGGAAIARPAQGVAKAAVVALLNSGPAPAAPASNAADRRAPALPGAPGAPVDPSLAAVHSAANHAALESADVQSARTARAIAQATTGATGMAAAHASLAKVSATLESAKVAGAATLKALQDVLSAQLASAYHTPPSATPIASAAAAAGAALAQALNSLAEPDKAAGAQVADAVTTASAAVGATIATVYAAALDAAVTASFQVPADQALTLEAASPGSWGRQLSVALDRNNINDLTALRFQADGLQASDLFNIDVIFTRDNGSIDMERFTNVTVNSKLVGNKPLSNRLDLVLAAGSRYVRVPLGADGKPLLPAHAPVSGSDTVSATAIGGDEGQALSTGAYLGDEHQETGLYLLKKTDLFNMLCIPPDVRGAGNDTDPGVYRAALALCAARRAMLILDPPSDWTSKHRKGEIADIRPGALNLAGEQSRNAAVYFPRIVKEDVLMDGQPDVFPACGAIAGVIAASDMQRGVWKAPAGPQAGLANLRALEVSLSDQEQGLLNPLGINCLRTLPAIGPVVWGARTLRGAGPLSDDYQYLPVRRLALFLEESLYRGTRWAEFEPNNEALWSALRLSINAFMGDLASQGAFHGFKVQCDADTNPPASIDLGIVTVLVQYAPVKPAEFVVLQFQQRAGNRPS